MSASLYCRFLSSETCRDGLNIADHALETDDTGKSRWRHPDGLDARGYFAFGDKAVIRR